jgi:general secretion pathway protein G
VEILIVVIILGILAAMIIPQFSNAARTSRESVLREDLRFMRSQIQVYQAQHNGVAPGYPGGDASQTPTAEAFVDQMTQYTSMGGAVSATSDATHNLGQYLSRMPENPINDLDTVQIVSGGTFPEQADDSHGWVYKPATLRFASDAIGSDAEGRAYFSY